MDSTTISSIIGFSLFALSEILTFINVPANGVLHALTVGMGNAFVQPQKNVDVEMAQSLVSNPQLANVINTMNTNPQIKNIIDHLINNPTFANNISSVQNNSNISTLISMISSHPDFKNAMESLVKNPSLVSKLVN